MDWTATTFGVLAAVIGTLFAAVVALVRRELDHHRERLAAFEARLLEVERMLFLLSPLANQMERKMDEQAVTIIP